MDVSRKPWQGVGNVVRFNWHFYLLAVAVCVGLMGTGWYLGGTWSPLLTGMAIAALITVLISLAVTYYVYDRSDLYQLPWLARFLHNPPLRILNVNAGFDETSLTLRHQFPKANLAICDFYDPAQHTEVSIKRARKAYPPDPATVKINTQTLPYPNAHFDLVCVTFAAHEIRNPAERQHFFTELSRVLTPKGHITVTEHLRDVPNFLAYTIGFFHFYSKQAWYRTFDGAGLQCMAEAPTTPFVRTFILAKDAISP